jgi:toxin ParE1/3/4
LIVPTVDFTHEARADIQSIVTYTIDQWGARQARHYVAGLRKFCVEIALMPVVGTDASWLAPGMRRFPYESHVVYYNEISGGVVVIAVIHKNQDPNRRFKP